MYDFIVGFYKTHKLYESLFFWEIGFSLAVFGLITYGNMFGQQRDSFKKKLSRNEKYVILYNDFSEKGIDDKMIFCDYIMFLVTLIISLIFAALASVQYSKVPLQNPLPQNTVDMIFLSVLFCFVLLILGFLEIVWMLKFKLSKSFEKIYQIKLSDIYNA